MKSRRPKMYSKFISIGFALALSLGFGPILSGCGGSDSSSADPYAPIRVPEAPTVPVPSFTFTPSGFPETPSTGDDCEDARNPLAEKTVLARCYAKLSGKPRLRHTDDGLNGPRDCVRIESTRACKTLRRGDSVRDDLCKTVTTRKNGCGPKPTRTKPRVEYELVPVNLDEAN